MFLIGLSNFIEAKPVTVTVNVPGGYVRTDRWEDPSSCKTFDRIVCNTESATCYKLTYTYDDAVSVSDQGFDFEEGGQEVPTHIILQKFDGEIIDEGELINYQDYALPENGVLYAAYEFFIEDNLQVAQVPEKITVKGTFSGIVTNDLGNGEVEKIIACTCSTNNCYTIDRSSSSPDGNQIIEVDCEDIEGELYLDYDETISVSSNGVTIFTGKLRDYNVETISSEETNTTFVIQQ